MNNCLMETAPTQTPTVRPTPTLAILSALGNIGETITLSVLGDIEPCQRPPPDLSADRALCAKIVPP